MGMAGCSSFGFRSLFVIFGLVVIAYANITNIHHGDDEWIDLHDMINYDSTAKRMRKPAEKRGTTAQRPTCLPVFKRFLSKLLKETGKLGLPNDAETVMHYDAEMKLSKQMVAEFQKLLKEDDDWTTGAVDDALSEILVNFKHHDHKSWIWRFEDTFHMELHTVMMVLLCVLVVTAVICTELWSAVCWFVQLRRMFPISFFISWIWNWFHLYMVEFAEHQRKIVQMESFNAKCTGIDNMTWMDSILEWYRSTWTLQDDPCKKYYDVILVNPILRVTPIKAFTVTITSLFTDALLPIGQGINEFLRALLKDLPITLQIPVFLVFTGAIFAFIYGGAQAATQHALGWLWPGRRYDPPPPAVGHPQAPQLRQDKDFAGGDAQHLLQGDQEDNRINRAGLNQGFRARDADVNAPQPCQEGNRTVQPRERENQSSTKLRHRVGRSSAAQTLPVKTLHSTTQQRHEEDDCIEGGEEHDVDEVPKVEEEKNPSAKEKKEQKDTEDRSDNEPTSNAPSKQIDVKTLGANQEKYV